MNDPIFNQLLALIKDLNKAMKDIKQILDDLQPSETDCNIQKEVKNMNTCPFCHEKLNPSQPVIVKFCPYCGEAMPEPFLSVPFPEEV